MRRGRAAKLGTCCGLAPKKAATMCAAGHARPASQAAEWVDRGRDAVNQQKEQFRVGLRSWPASLSGSHDGDRSAEERLFGTGVFSPAPAEIGLGDGGGWLMENLTPVFIALTGAAVALQAGVLAGHVLGHAQEQRAFGSSGVEVKTKAIPTMETGAGDADGTSSPSCR